MTNLNLIFTGAYKILSPLHHYDKANTNEDVIIVVTQPYDTIYYVAINNSTEDVIIRQTVRCKDAIKKAILTEYPEIVYSYLYIDNVFGVYSYIDEYKIATIFLILKHKYTNNSFVVQLDIVNNNPENFRIKGILELYNKTHMYFDTSVSTNTVVTDYKETNNTDAYIAYINMDNRTEINSANIEGIHLLVTKDEKLEFSQKNNIEIPDEIYPLLNTWDLHSRIFFKLTEDTKKIKFNFSTGLGFIKFE